MKPPATKITTKIDSERSPELSDAEPVLLAMTAGNANEDHSNCDPTIKSCLGQLHIIETESGPSTEKARVLELLRYSPEVGSCLADPTEVHAYHNPLASVNAYKHRLHAIRCEYVEMRMRLEDELHRIRSSALWRLANRLHRWRDSVWKYVYFLQKKKPSPK